MSAYDYSGKVVEIDGSQQYIPEFSEWKEVCNCCGNHMVYFPSIDSYFCNQWEFSFKFPGMVIALIIFAFGAGVWSAFNSMNASTRNTFLIIGVVIFIIWGFAYFEAMCSSPGFLPWYWAVERREKYSFEEQMGGVITNDEQYEFAFENDKPERGSLSKQARRIVLRADHICKWISNWVGLKNYRYFFIQLIWFCIMFIYFFAILGFDIYSIFTKGWVNGFQHIVLFIVAIPVVLFFIFFVIVFFRHVRYLVTNNTTLHELKAERTGDMTNPYDLGCWNNCTETLGPGICCPLWFLPVPLPRKNNGFKWRRNDVPDNEDMVLIQDPDLMVRKMLFDSDAAAEEDEESSDEPMVFSTAISESEPSTIFDALIQKTIDDDDDNDDYTAYANRLKKPPMPPEVPIVVKIIPQEEATPQKKHIKKKKLRRPIPGVDDGKKRYIKKKTLPKPEPESSSSSSSDL